MFNIKSPVNHLSQFSLSSSFPIFLLSFFMVSESSDNDSIRSQMVLWTPFFFSSFSHWCLPLGTPHYRLVIFCLKSLIFEHPINLLTTLIKSSLADLYNPAKINWIGTLTLPHAPLEDSASYVTLLTRLHPSFGLLLADLIGPIKLGLFFCL